MLFVADAELLVVAEPSAIRVLLSAQRLHQLISFVLSL